MRTRCVCNCGDDETYNRLLILWNQGTISLEDILEMLGTHPGIDVAESAANPTFDDVCRALYEAAADDPEQLDRAAKRLGLDV